VGKDWKEPEKDRRGINAAKVYSDRLKKRDVEIPPDFSPAADVDENTRRLRERLKEREIASPPTVDHRGFAAYEDSSKKGVARK
jgi:hypothetical protein